MVSAGGNSDAGGAGEQVWFLCVPLVPRFFFLFFFFSFLKFMLVPAGNQREAPFPLSCSSLATPELKANRQAVGFYCRIMETSLGLGGL